ncbi:hypothetical protein BpHYR1_000101 [Brachionus plicatilis]|uniref:Uncharacterized protein n=1 Tax=Brachionus plicatilis TaxID=10195 RepID=A0A3M7RNG9_BRAPC|nr:hypothetical protein BpHYR1_000101 [Brachionus plicatilis]
MDLGHLVHSLDLRSHSCTHTPKKIYYKKENLGRTVNDFNKISILLADIDKISISLDDIDKISIPLDDIEILSSERPKHVLALAQNNFIILIIGTPLLPKISKNSDFLFLIIKEPSGLFTLDVKRIETNKIWSTEIFENNA